MSRKKYRYKFGKVEIVHRGCPVLEQAFHCRAVRRLQVAAAAGFAILMGVKYFAHSTADRTFSGRARAELGPTARALRGMTGDGASNQVGVEGP